MFRKTLSSILILITLFGFSACNVEGETENKETTDSYSYTMRKTVVYNYFKDRIPEPDFENDPIEKYEQAKCYIMTVKCSQKEYEKYLKKLKKAGFDDTIVETETYYSANDSEGYYVEVTYVGENLTVYVK